MRSLVFVTGTRADFGKLQPLAQASLEAGHKVTFFVTGMHMLPSYGLTKIEVHNMEGINVTEFVNQREGDPLDLVFSKTLQCFSDYLQIEKPDLVVVHGDRVEAMAACFVCSTNYIRCAHVEGGEVSGTIDEIFRHCNTKMANIHLVSSELARRRILSMGEPNESVYVIGSPELDTHSHDSGVQLSDVINYYQIDSNDYAIVIFHPVTSEQDSIKDQALHLFDCLDRSGKYYVVIKPNNDPGTQDIQAVINGLDSSRFRVIPSMRFSHFSELLRNSNLIIGNSSTGVREAPFLGIPSLDIGTRQTNRALGDSVIHCSAFDTQKISNYIEDMWGVKFPRSREFGEGSAASNFKKLLSNQEFWSIPLQKKFVDSSLIEASQTNGYDD